MVHLATNSIPPLRGALVSTEFSFDSLSDESMTLSLMLQSSPFWWGLLCGVFAVLVVLLIQLWIHSRSQADTTSTHQQQIVQDHSSPAPESARGAISRTQQLRSGRMVRLVHSTTSSDLEIPGEVNEEAEEMEFGRRGSMPLSAFSRHSLLEQPDELPSVTFAAPFYIGMENQGIAIVRVMRVGDLSGTSIVPFSTVDDTAHAGVSYHALTGVLMFAPGEYVKEIRIELIDNDLFQQSDFFHVELQEEIGDCKLSGAILGPRHMRITKVRIYDDDTFPNNDYKEIVKQGKLATVNRYALLLSYVSYNFWSDSYVRSSTLKTILIGQIHNLGKGATLLIGVYLVDKILNPKVSNDDLMHFEGTDEALAAAHLSKRTRALAVLASLSVLLALSMHILRIWEISLDVATAARRSLAASLLQRFLYCEEKARHQVCAGQFMMILFNDTQGLVANGYMRCLNLVKLLGEFIVYFAFLTSASLIFGRRTRPGQEVLVCLMVLPMLLILSMMVTYRQTLQLLKEEHDTYADCFDMGIQLADNDKLIKEYRRQAFFRARFQTLWDRYAAAVRSAGNLLEHQSAVATLLSVLLVGTFTFILGVRVLNGKMEVGMLMATISVVTNMGSIFGKAQKEMVMMQRSIGALMRLSNHMNLPSDLYVLKHMGDQSEQHNVRHALKLLEKSPMKIDKHRMDRFPIEFDHIAIQPRLTTAPCSLGGSLVVRQGTCVALLGPPGEGKSELLRMLNGEVVRDGTLERKVVGKLPYVPSHMRVISAGREANFLRGTLWFNLTMGMETDEGETRHDANIDRVMSICRRLGLSDKALAFIGDPNEPKPIMVETKDDQETSPEEAAAAKESLAAWEKRQTVMGRNQWHHTLSTNDKALIQLARAFIANPHLLCLFGSGANIDSLSVKHVASMINEFVKKSGIEDNLALKSRRPRTVIMTCYRKAEMDIADRIIHVSADGGIREISKDEVTQEMFH